MTDEAVKWVRSSMGEPVSNAVPGRGSVDRRELVTYVGRVQHEGELLPGTVHLHFKCIQVLSQDGNTHTYQQYEVLTLNPGFKVYWKPGQNGRVDDRAIECGHTADYEKLYIGKVADADGDQLCNSEDGLPFLGKIQPSHGSIYWISNNVPRRSQNYDILIAKKSKWARFMSAVETFNEAVAEGPALVETYQKSNRQTKTTLSFFKGQYDKIFNPKK